MDGGPIFVRRNMGFTLKEGEKIGTVLRIHLGRLFDGGKASFGG